MKRKLTVKEMVCGGLFGLPVFTAGGGIGYIVRPSFGYLIGFVVAAFITGFVVERSPRNSFRKYLCAAFCGFVVTYAIGLVYKYFMLNFYVGEKTAFVMVIADCFPLDMPGDAAYVKQISGFTQSLDTMVPYIYEEAVSPHLAARKEGNPIELSVVKAGYDKLVKEYDMVVMEGSGGILCPLRCDEEQELWLEDVIRDIKLPCIVVADAGLGTINATVLTIEYLRMKAIEVKGVILNHYEAENEMYQDNRIMIERRGKVPVIACVESGAEKIQGNHSCIFT